MQTHEQQKELRKQRRAARTKRERETAWNTYVQEREAIEREERELIRHYHLRMLHDAQRD